jgi:hypothetical protein
MIDLRYMVKKINFQLNFILFGKVATFFILYSVKLPHFFFYVEMLPHFFFYVVKLRHCFLGKKNLIVTGSRLVRVLTRVNAAVPVVTISSASSVWERSEPTSGGGSILHLRLCLSALNQSVRSLCSIGILGVFMLGRSQLSFDSM